MSHLLDQIARQLTSDSGYCEPESQGYSVDFDVAEARVKDCYRKIQDMLGPGIQFELREVEEEAQASKERSLHLHHMRLSVKESNMIFREVESHYDYAERLREVLQKICRHIKPEPGDPAPSVSIKLERGDIYVSADGLPQAEAEELWHDACGYVRGVPEVKDQPAYDSHNPVAFQASAYVNRIQDPDGNWRFEVKLDRTGLDPHMLARIETNLGKNLAARVSADAQLDQVHAEESGRERQRIVKLVTELIEGLGYDTLPGASMDGRNVRVPVRLLPGQTDLQSKLDVLLNPKTGYAAKERMVAYVRVEPPDDREGTSSPCIAIMFKRPDENNHAPGTFLPHIEQWLTEAKRRLDRGEGPGLLERNYG